MTRYSDGGVFAIPTTEVRLPLSSISRQYLDQKFTLVLLNRGGNLITVFFTPLLQPRQTFEVPVSSPGVVLDGLGYEEFVNGISAIASTGTTNLLVKLYSNDITFRDEVAKSETELQTLYPRNTNKKVGVYS